MSSEPFRVGELARRSGLTVRTLHYYDEIGLLVPSQRSDGGYRLYHAGDVARLQKITSLRSLGFSLEAVRECIDSPDFAAERVVALQLSRIEEHLTLQSQLKARLQSLAAMLSGRGDVSIDDFLETIEVTVMHDKYYSKDQLDSLAKRASTMGSDAVQRAESQWLDLIDEVRKHMADGSDPGSAPVQELARRWRDLVSSFTGGDAGIAASLTTMYKQEGAAKASRNMLDEDLMAFMSRAMQTLD